MQSSPPSRDARSAARCVAGLLASLAVFVGACGGGAGGTEPSGSGDAVPDPAQTPPPGQPEPGAGTKAFPQFAVSFRTGDFWEYAWTRETSFGSSAGVDVNSEGGRFRIEIADPVTSAGRQGFAIRLSGTAPRPFTWEALAWDQQGLYGLAEGSWSVLFDATDGSWAGGGLFANFDASTLTEAVDGAIDNAWLGQPAIQAGRSASQDRCEDIAGITVCGDESFAASEFEYYDPIVGVIAYEYRDDRLDDGGGFTTTFNDALSLGLVASSLRGDAVDHALEIEPNNSPQTATVVTEGSITRASIAREDAFGDGVTVSIARAESEPNDDFEAARRNPVREFPSRLAGRVASVDAGIEIVTDEPGDNVSFVRTIEDVYALEPDGACDTFYALHSPETNGRLDMLLFAELPSGALEAVANDLDLTPLGLRSRSNLDRVPALAEGMRYFLGVDAVDVLEPMSYDIELSCDGVLEVEDPQVYDWFALALPAQGTVSISATGDVELFITDADGNRVIERGRRDRLAGTSEITTALEPGEWRIAVAGAGEYRLEVAP